MKKTLWLLGVILSASILWHLSANRTALVHLPVGDIALPRRDLKRLEYLFRELIVYNSAGYTFLGHKPLSFEHFSEPRLEWDLPYLWHTLLPSNLKKYQAWKTWQKYEHLFSKSNILIWSETCPWLKNGKLIVVANRKELQRVLQENQEDFAVFGVTDPKALFRNSLVDEKLLGTLLGYGRINALLYEKKNPDIKPVFSNEIQELFKATKAALNFTFGWPGVEMEEILMFPNFMADLHNPETQNLKSEYLQTRAEILAYYKDKDFVEATLLLLSQ